MCTHEFHQEKKLVDFRDSLAMRLREAYFSIRRSAQQHLSGTGATVDQVVVLTLLAAEEGLTQQDLVERAFSDPSTIRQILVLLEKRLWIRRESCSADARAKRVYLTAEGRKQQRQLKRMGHIGDPRNMEDLLSPKELQMVVDCLQRISSAQPVNWRPASAPLKQHAS
jgi:DNA-binding MarR family transcriptional regulator